MECRHGLPKGCCSICEATRKYAQELATKNATWNPCTTVGSEDGLIAQLKEHGFKWGDDMERDYEDGSLWVGPRAAA